MLLLLLLLWDVVVVIEFLQERTTRVVESKVARRRVPIVVVAWNDGDYTIVVGVASAMLTIDAGCDVNGGLVMGWVGEMDVLGRRSTRSRRVGGVGGISVELERIHGRRSKE
jgi:hypothetical protein